MYDISNLSHRNILAETLLRDIEEHSVKIHAEDRRKYLGISSIGERCARRLWYKFRWAKQETFEGRVLRLFERGQMEEQRFHDYLTGIGFRFGKRMDETQTRVTGCEGHYGGSMDNTGWLPERYGIPEEMLVEYKTMADKYFHKLKKSRMKLAHPEYWDQHCAYGYKMGLEYGMFVVVNKNTDEWHIEINRIDDAQGKYCEDKALSIITAKPDNPPLKISMSGSNFTCKWCEFKEICHDGGTPEKNCRSCQHAIPIADAKWGCNLYNVTIPEDFIPKGCDSHKAIK